MLPFIEDVYELDDLIFGNIGDGSNVYWGVFTETELSYGFLPLYYTILTLAAVFFVGFIVTAGMRIASSSKSASKRNEMIEFTKELILVGLAFIFLPTFYTILFQVNESIVGVFESKLSNGVFDINNAVWGTSDGKNLALSENQTFSNVEGFIGKLLISFVIFGLGIWANFYYLMRRVTLLILMSIGPLMVVFWMFPQWKGITMTWLRELTGTIFVQSIHAFVFWLVAVVSITESNSGSGLLGAIIVYIIFIPISEQIRGLLGMGGNMVGNLNKAGAMMGMAALGGMVGAVKGAMGDQSVMSALKGLKDGTKKFGKDVKDKGVSEALKDAGGRATEAAFASAKNMNMLKAGEIASKAGKAVGGMAGSLIGSPMGPVGALAGAEIASKGAGAIGGLAGRVGYAGGSKVASRFKGAKTGLDALNDARTNGDENVANAIADQEAASWGDQHKGATMKQLRESFPTASQQELDQKYSNIVAQKAQQFKANAGNTMAQAKMIAGNMGNAQNATQTAASAMADQWGADNKDAFMSDWKTNNPRGAKESMGSYNKRAQQAFGDKKASMQDSFAKDGELFARDNGINGEVNKEQLATFMGAAASKHAGAGNISNLTSAASNAMAHVSGAKMFNGAGKPNMPLIANSIAAAKTEQDKNAHIQSAMAGGATMEQAQASWKQVESSTMAKNLQPFATKGFENSLVGKSVDTSGGRLQATAQNFGNMVKGAYAQDMQALQNGTAILSSAVGAGKEAFTTSMTGPNGNMMNSFGNAVSSASQAASQQIVANYGGDAVKAQQAITQSAGFAGGVLLGRRGMEMAQGGALGVMSRTGLGNAVQSQVSSASEIIQMAHKVQDDNGIMQVAPGAIKQVTTRDGSYVQVRTASGETRTVSRIGAGSESLKKGEVIYQDMTSSDGSTMEIDKVGNTGVSTYKMDSGGARIPVQHDVQNPMALIGGASSSPVHGHVSRPVAPPLQQRVDAGTYHTEDLASAVQSGQLSNVQVVIDKGQQYLTADSGGQTYRVSPITKGDARMSNNQSISIPVEVNSAGQIAVPQSNVEIGPSGAPIGAKGVVTTLRQSVGNVTETQTVSSPNGQNIVRQVNQAKVNVLEVEDANGQTTNAVPNVVTQTVKQVIASQQPQMKGNVNIPNSVGQASVQQGTEDYVLGQVDFSHLMKSRTYEHAQRNVNRRRQLDEVRSPQGQAF